MKKIKFIYSVEENVVFCFWKYFFEACGIETVGERIENSVQEGADIYIYILPKNEWERVDKSQKNVFYILRKWNEKLNEREDVMSHQWSDKKSGSYHDNRKLLLWLFDKTSSDFVELQSILDIFQKNKLWQALWLFRESPGIARQGEMEKTIIGTCGAVVKDIEDKEGIYYDYIRLYCLYITKTLTMRSTLGAELAIEQIMEAGEKLLKKRNDKLMVYNLLGRISKSSKYGGLSERYLKKAIEIERNSENLYQIGALYENFYGEWEKALEYYRSSYQMNNDCYRAAYKLGLDAEKRGRWEEAKAFYSCIEKKLYKDMGQPQISTLPVQYLFKTWRRLVNICRNVEYDEFEEMKYLDLKKKLQESIWHDDIYESNVFSTLFKCADTKDKKKKMERLFLKELKDKLMCIL